jgi:two-component system response regulator NreC
MAKLRILIADDHRVLLAGLRLLINSQPDMEVVAEAGTVHEAVGEARRCQPDVVLLDLSMPDGSGVAAISRLRCEAAGARIVVLTVHDESAYLHAALAAGACGYLVKTAAESELLAAVRAVSQGRVFVDLNLSQESTQALLGKRGGVPAGQPSLSRREREVLTLLAQGNSNQQVADHLFLSVKTVETYRARIGEKLGLHGRADLVRYAVEMGLLGPGSSPTEDPGS